MLSTWLDFFRTSVDLFLFQIKGVVATGNFEEDFFVWWNLACFACVTPFSSVPNRSVSHKITHASNIHYMLDVQQSGKTITLKHDKGDGGHGIGLTPEK